MELNRNNKTRPNPWLCSYSNLVPFDTHLLNTKFFFNCVCVWQFLAYLFSNNYALAVSPRRSPHKHQAHSKPFQKFFRTNTRPCIYRQLHLAYLLIDLFHKMNDKIDQFVLVHLFRVEIRYQKADVISFYRFAP